MEESIIPWAGQMVTVQRKPIKNIYLKVLLPEGRILLSVPKGYSRQAIEDVLASRREWLLSRQESIRENARKPAKHEYVTGEKIQVWGKAYELVVREAAGKRAKVACKGDKVLLFVPGYATKE